MSLYSQIASNAGAALNLIKKWTANPILAQVPIECRRFVVRADADVSQHVMIDLTGNKQNVTDNVAPGPHEWDVEGTVGGLPLELSASFMPSIRTFKNMLQQARLTREPVQFYDNDGTIWQVLIQHLEFEDLPEQGNRVNVRVTLRELNTMNITITGIGDIVAQAAVPAAGSFAGQSLSAGVTESLVAGAAFVGVGLLAQLGAVLK